MKIKGKCQSCQRIYLGGQNGVCNVCLAGKPRKRKVKPFYCLCGKQAVVVILAETWTPEDELLELEIPLCRQCLELERALEGESKSVDKPALSDYSRVVVVKSLPRARPRMSGRKI